MNKNVSLSEILKKNRKSLGGVQKIYKYCLVTNQFINPLNELLDFELRERGINVNTKIFEVNNLYANQSELISGDLIIVNYNPLADMQITSDFFYDSNNSIDTVLNRTKIDITRIMKIIPEIKPIIFLLFSSKNITSKFESITLIDKLMFKLNHWVIETYPNVNFVDSTDIMAEDSLPYFPRVTNDLNKYPLIYLKKLCNKISNLVMSLVGTQKKVLILDCDGTLWKGLVGEQELSELKYFNEIHNMIKTFSDSGVLICLVTKNERINIDKFLANNEIITHQQVIKIFANWEAKSKNIIKISEELNLNIDSFVFVDDSIVEIKEVKNALPSITTLIVNPNYDTYIRDLTALFPQFVKGKITYEDRHRTASYLVEDIRSKDKVLYGSENDYLESLEMILIIKFDELQDSERISQLTIKTNQFNLTQKRFAPSEISKLIKDVSFLVISIRLQDKYTDLGLVGAAILELQDDYVNILNINLSCRAFSRRLEYVIMEEIVRYSKMQKYLKIKGEFCKSDKNMYAANYYNDNNFTIVSSDNEITKYELNLKSFNTDSNEKLFKKRYDK